MKIGLWGIGTRFADWSSSFTKNKPKLIQIGAKGVLCNFACVNHT